jgi:hypothetical protein
MDYLSISLLILIVILIILLFCNRENFYNFNNTNSENFNKNNLIDYTKNNNSKFLNEYNSNNFQIIQDEKLKNKAWNNNNTLESMNCYNSPPNRLSQWSAPSWWYPAKEYSAKDWKVPFYGDYYNPINNYLGNVQEMYWQFN